MSIINYFVINDAINKVFFDGRFESIPIYLDLEDDMLEEVAVAASLSADEFELELGLNVSRTLFWDDANIYSAHLDQLKKWRSNGSKSTPPFTALLVTFSLAAEHMRKGDEYSGNNYYQRLAEIYGIKDDSSKAKLSAAGKHSLIFWKILNQWLLDNNHAYGSPTAKQVNNWKYVSYSISQSLVRDIDRKNLHKMFSRFGLLKHERLSEFEIYRYLSEWMLGPEPSSWLKKLWRTEDLKDRVVSAAMGELELWEGGAQRNQSVNAPSHKLSWAVAIGGFLNSGVYLYLITTVGNDFREQKLRHSSEPSALAKEAFKNCEEFWLGLLQGTTFACLNPINKINVNALMVASFEVSSKDSQDKYRYESRAIIPLIKLDGSALFREVAKLSLFTNHLILCHETSKTEVNSYLQKYARAGFLLRESSNTRGVPSNWVMFEHVEIVSVPTEYISGNLQCLVPLSEGVNIHFNGGLKLSPGIWHSMAPPEVVAFDDNGLLDVEMATQDSLGLLDTVTTQQRSQYNPNFLKTVDGVLNLANFTIFAKKAGKTLAEKDVSFRSADTPRNLSSARDKALNFCLDATLKFENGLTASEIKSMPLESVCLQGMLFTGAVNEDFEEKVALLEHELLSSSNAEDGGWQRQYNNAPIETISETCILRGHHHWLCTMDSRSMTCRDCHEFQLTRKAAGKKKGAAVTLLKPNENTPRTDFLPRILNDPAKHISPNIVFDAICYKGAGSWLGLQNMLSEVVDVPWKVSLANQNLIDLGHIDVMMQPKTTRPSYWSCSPPVLVMTHNGLGFLAGFRNAKLITELKSSLAQIAKSYEIIESDQVPDAHIWNLEAHSRTQIESALNGVLDPFNRQLRVVKSPAKSIVLAMPSIADIAKSFTSIHMENREDIERFDLTTLKWLPAKLNCVGAFRTSFAGRRYFYRNVHGNCTEMGFELTKLIAARDEGVYLHNYNRNTSSFECIIGCDPPGLFRRALVSCSGLLPQIKDEKTQYTNVPEELGFLLMNRLYH